MIQKELLRLYRKFKKCLVFNHNSPLKAKHPCLICQTQSTKHICQACREEYLTQASYRCSCCGIALEHDALFCGECLRYPPAFDRTFSPYIYQKPLSELIIAFKKKHSFRLAKGLSELFTQQIQQQYRQQHLPLPDLIVAVPQHYKRRWSRGFSPSILLAQALSQDLQIPLFKDVKRTQSNTEQKSLNRRERFKNIANSFKVSSPLQGEHIVIVDDVMTTGATANALAKALKEAGAAQVSVWVLARTPKNPIH